MASEKMMEVLRRNMHNTYDPDREQFIANLMENPQDRWWLCAFLIGTLVTEPGFEVHSDVVYSTDGQHPSYTITGPVHA